VTDARVKSLCWRARGGLRTVPRSSRRAGPSTLPPQSGAAMRRAFQRTLVALPLVFLLAYGDAEAQSRVTTPEEHFGHAIGSDYWLPNYTQFQAYWERLAAESDRRVLATLGMTAEGRPPLTALITPPQSHTRLDRDKEVAQRLARAEGLPGEQARALAKEGKAVGWLDGGLHATEVLGASQLIETVFQLLSRD